RAAHPADAYPHPCHVGPRPPRTTLCPLCGDTYKRLGTEISTVRVQDVLWRTEPTIPFGWLVLPRVRMTVKTKYSSVTLHHKIAHGYLRLQSRIVFQYHCGVCFSQKDSVILQC